MSPDSGDIMPDSGQNGRISGYIAGSRPGSGRFGQNGRTPGIWPDPAVLAESPASWQETSQDGRIPGNWPGSGRFVPDSGNFAGICIC
jgi:hypothetical protein